VTTLMEIYRRMLDTYGPQGWWPGDSRFEMIAGAILTQAAAWRNVERALENLRAAGVDDWPSVHRIEVDALAQLVRPSGYYNAKAKKLKALAEYLGERFSDDIDAMGTFDTRSLRAELLAVHGIGHETADDILLYALDKPVFVIDAYTRRLLSRLGVADGKEPYAQHQHLFMAELPADAGMFAEYHALIVTHAKVSCRKSPACGGCVLLDICPTGQAQTDS